MFKKIVIATAVAAAAFVGSGTIALAATGPSTATTAVTAASSTASDTAPEHVRRIARNAIHGQVVTRGKDGTFVTHVFARGTVAALAVASGGHKWIEVHSADGTRQRFALTDHTTVRLRSGDTWLPGVLKDLRVGDRVLVTGVGTGTPTARHIFDAGKPSSTRPAP